MNFLNVLLVLFANYGQKTTNPYINRNLNEAVNINEPRHLNINKVPQKIILKQGSNTNRENKVQDRREISLEFTPTRQPVHQNIPPSVNVGSIVIREHLRFGESRLIEGCRIDNRTPCHKPDQIVTEEQCIRWKCCWNATDKIQCARNKYHFVKLRQGPDYGTCGKVTEDLPAVKETSLRPLLLAFLKGRIIGGMYTTEGSWPWMAYIYIPQLGVVNGGVCGGSLISDQWVVTAAHCFETPIPSLYGVILGEHTLSITTNNEVFRSIERIVIHPSYSTSTFNNDIALVKLSSPVTFNAYVRPICVVPPGTRTDSSVPPTYTGVNCVTLGWGLTSTPGGTTSDILLELRQVISPDIGCHAITSQSSAISLYGNRPVFPGQSKFCAGGVLAEDTCEGDSGGPLICQNDDGTYFLHGITSYGTTPCALQGMPGVFTKVTDFSTWIDSIIAAS